MKIKVLSLFDGISCARVALDRLGYEVDYWSSEVDKYAIQIAQKNWPDTKQLGDIKQIDGYTGYHFDDIDLLIGGSPCQDLSIAKKDRKGLAGERSGLFYEYVRILNEIKPKYFVLENVNSMPKEAKEQISEILGVQPIMINAALVSAQNRKRLFWTNILGVTQPADRGILLRDVLEDKVDESFYVKDKSNTIRTSGRGSGIDDKHNWDTIRIGQLNKGGQGDRIYSPDGKSVNLSANGGGRGAKTGLYCIGIIPESIKPKGNYLPRERVFSTGGKFRAISTVSNQQPYIERDSIIRKLTPLECTRLQSLPDGYVEAGVSNTQKYKALGNAFNVEVVRHILSFMKF